MFTVQPALSTNVGKSALTPVAFLTAKIHPNRRHARAMAFIAINESTGEMLGVVRLHSDADFDTAEFAILVRSDQKGHGLGWQLMRLIVAYARAQGIRSVHGQVLQENAAMLDMCRNLGFQVKSDPEEPSLVIVTLPI